MAAISAPAALALLRLLGKRRVDQRVRLGMNFGNVDRVGAVVVHFVALL